MLTNEQFTALLAAIIFSGQAEKSTVAANEAVSYAEAIQFLAQTRADARARAARFTADGHERAYPGEGSAEERASGNG